MRVFLWVLFFLICWALGTIALRAAWLATRTQTPVPGSLTVTSGEHSGAGTEVLGLWGLGVALFLAPFGAFALLGHGGPSSTAASSTPTAPTETSVAPSSEYRFTTTDDNIACVMRADASGESVRCDIQRKSWAAPPKPATCRDNWGNSLLLTAEGPSMMCAADNVLRDRTVLRAGAADTVGGLTCSSTGAGVQCALRGHGFRLSAAVFNTF